MPDLSFAIEGAEPAPFAASPLLYLKLRITESHILPIHTVALRCQIRIEPAKRRYESGEKDRLIDLFGESARWGQTLKSLLWAHTSVIVPPFEGNTLVDLPVPCSADFNLAASKYFLALEDGEIPLTLLFSGTIFYPDADGALQVSQISWEKEAAYRLPVSVWQQMMHHYFPHSGWLCMRKDAFDRLREFKTRNGLTTWEEAIDKLLDRRQVAT